MIIRVSNSPVGRLVFSSKPPYSNTRQPTLCFSTRHGGGAETMCCYYSDLFRDS